MLKTNNFLENKTFALLDVNFTLIKVRIHTNRHRGNEYTSSMSVKIQLSIIRLAQVCFRLLTELSAQRNQAHYWDSPCCFQQHSVAKCFHQQ